MAGNLHVFFGKGVIVGQFGPVRDVHQGVDDDVLDTAGQDRFGETVGLERKRGEGENVQESNNSISRNNKAILRSVNRR